MTGTDCRHCRGQVERNDRFCRHCGQALGSRPDWAQGFFQQVLDTLPDGVFVLDGESRVRFWNRAMEAHTGWHRRDLIGRRVFDALPYLAPHAHRILQALEEALPVRLEPGPADADPERALPEGFWFGPLLLESGAPAILGVMSDGPRRMRVDEELIRSERLAAIGELAAGVAHNFNNIMAAIGGDAQLLKLTAEDEGLPPHVAETARQIFEETMRGGRVAHDLLSFARGAEPSLQRLDVREVLNDAVRLIRNHPAARSAVIELDFSPDLPLVQAAPHQLHQVVFNVLLNALQAMPSGGIVTVSASVRDGLADPDQGVLDIKVHDTGVGIPREHLQRIFTPFFTHRASGNAGSGLGLPVSLAMIRGMGGDLQISSVEGIGTTVTLTLPVVERRSARRGTYRAPTVGRALVVDQDERVRRTLTTLLGRRGFDAVTAADGREALMRLDAARSGAPICVLLMELSLPRDEGAAVIRRVRELNPDVPIIVLTDVTDSREMLDALSDGARFGFSKPPDFDSLLEVVDRLAEPCPAG